MQANVSFFSALASSSLSVFRVLSVALCKAGGQPRDWGQGGWVYVDDGRTGGEKTTTERSGGRRSSDRQGSPSRQRLFDSSVINGLAGGHGDPRKRRRVEAEEMTSEMTSERRD